MSDLSLGILTLIALISLVGGIGISAVGPGGVLPTIGLFALTPLAPATVAGTAILTHVATGLAGTAAYTRSGQLRDRQTRTTATWLTVSALVGTPLGVAVHLLPGRTLKIVMVVALFAPAPYLALHS